MSIESLIDSNGLYIQSKIVSKLCKKINGNDKDLLIEYIEGEGHNFWTMTGRDFWTVTGWNFAEDMNTLEEVIECLRENYRVREETLEEFEYKYVDTNTRWNILDKGDNSISVIKKHMLMADRIIGEHTLKMVLEQC